MQKDQEITNLRDSYDEQIRNLNNTYNKRITNACIAYMNCQGERQSDKTVYEMTERGMKAFKEFKKNGRNP